MVVGAALACRPLWSLAAATTDAVHSLRALETKHGGRLGVAVLATATGRRIAYRAHERFLVCSTFKLLLVAAVLWRVDHGEARLDRRVVFERDVLLDWSPVTQLNVGQPGMSIRELCQAAMLMSDNTAANLLLDTIGGPAGVTAFARRLGDPHTRLDHKEPLNNESDGEQDTTTPAAMLADMQAILLGDVLSADSRQMLSRWFALNQTGAQSLRAGLPFGWRVGDKTGSASNANNDIAIARPPGGQPVLISAYYMNDSADTAERKAVLADVGRLVASSMS